MMHLLISSIAIFSIFVYGTVGEIITEKSGHLNLGTPGVMCFGGIGGCLGVVLASNIVGVDNGFFSGFVIILFSIIFTIIFGGLAGLIYSFLTVTLRANQNVTGLTLTTFGAAMANFLGSKINRMVLVATSNQYFQRMFPATDESNEWLQLFFGHSFLVYLAIIVAILCAIFLKKTKLGLGLRAVGENPATADAQGLSVRNYRYVATIAGSIISGFGGLTYIMVQMNGNFEQAVSIEGLGWLAVALVIFSIWKPTLAIFGSFLFALLYQLPYAGILELSNTSMEFTKMLPYLVTILVLIITSIVGKKQVLPPAALGTNYFREDR